MATEREMHPLSRKQPTLLGSRTEKGLLFGVFCSPAPGGGCNPHFTDMRPDGVTVPTTLCCRCVWILVLMLLIDRGSAGKQGRDAPFSVAAIL